MQALAVNHDLLVKNQWRSIEASDLISGQLAHFGDLVGTRILFDGPPLRLSSSAAQSIGMVIHELSTNAVKYGALSGDDGRIDIDWEMEVTEPSLSQLVGRKVTVHLSLPPPIEGLARLSSRKWWR